MHTSDNHSLKPAVLLLFIKGAVQGPEEFAEGLVIGVRSLLGHTVGNTKHPLTPLQPHDSDVTLL